MALQHGFHRHPVAAGPVSRPITTLPIALSPTTAKRPWDPGNLNQLPNSFPTQRATEHLPETEPVRQAATVFQCTAPLRPKRRDPAFPFKRAKRGKTSGNLKAAVPVAKVKATAGAPR